MSIAPIRTLRHRNGGFKPFEQNFVYTGSVQAFTVPAKGLYKIELWGAQGGTGYGYSGGGGGYTVGYKTANKNDTWYICVGGKGSDTNSSPQSSELITSGGYNGGANGKGGYYANIEVRGGAGGGATHIGLSNSVLRYTADADILAVAGGGGGGMWYYVHGESDEGGAGGGTGGGLYGSDGGGSPSASGGKGGTQSSGAGKGYGSAGYPGGGSGYYGGFGGNVHNSGGGGGSGYVGGVPSVTYKDVTYTPSTTNGGNSGNGKAKITRIA